MTWHMIVLTIAWVSLIALVIGTIWLRIENRVAGSYEKGFSDGRLLGRSEAALVQTCKRGRGEWCEETVWSLCDACECKKKVLK